MPQTVKTTRTYWTWWAGSVATVVQRMKMKCYIWFFLNRFLKSINQYLPWFFTYKAQSSSDDERLISIVYEAYKEILRFPSAILRPYQSHLRTDRWEYRYFWFVKISFNSGANRTRNFEDLRFRFGVDAGRILRFSVPQIEEVVDVLQVHFLLNLRTGFVYQDFRFQLISVFVATTVQELKH